jgi:hypothetical protein
MVKGVLELNNRILKAIGESLLAAGKCPYDPSCPFGKGLKCNAPKEELEAKMQVITDGINYMPNQFASMYTTDAERPWHCDNIFIVEFVDPDE